MEIIEHGFMKEKLKYEIYEDFPKKRNSFF